MGVQYRLMPTIRDQRGNRPRRSRKPKIDFLKASMLRQQFLEQQGQSLPQKERSRPS